MNKVIIEITAESSTTTLTINGKTYVDKWVPTRTGASCEVQEIEDAEDISEELQDALTSLNQYHVMNALREL